MESKEAEIRKFFEDYMNSLDVRQMLEDIYWSMWAREQFVPLTFKDEKRGILKHMSRHAFTNDNFEVYVGVDHMPNINAFIQVYDLRNGGGQDDKDCADVAIDSQGVREEQNIPELARELETMRARFSASHHAFPNLGASDIIDLMSLLGFTEHGTAVMEIMD